MGFDWSPAISAGAAFVAACLAGLALLANWRSAAAAEASADAAKAALDAATRVRWTVVHRHGSGFQLTNTGGQVAYGVQVLGVPLYGETGHWELIGPGDAVEFHASRGGDEGTFMVTWHHQEDHSDDAVIWRHPLPLD